MGTTSRLRTAQECKGASPSAPATLPTVAPEDCSSVSASQGPPGGGAWSDDGTESPPSRQRTRSRPAKILFVDDEGAVRRVGQRALCHAGFEVMLAETGTEAVSVFRQHQHEIDLVILDLSMPGMDGLQTLDALRGVDPRVRVVLSSGFNSIDADTLSTAPGTLGFIQKPYHSTELAETVRELVGAAEH